MSSNNVMKDLQNEFSKFKLRFGKKQKSIPEEAPAAIVGADGDVEVVLVETTTSASETANGGGGGGAMETLTTIKKTFAERVTSGLQSPEVETVKRSFNETMSNVRNLPQSESFQKFVEQANRQMTELDARMQNFWKKPEPLVRPAELNLTLIGVALFKGNEFISKAIRKFTKSRFSHVALLLSDVAKDKDDPDAWYIYSANGSASQILDEHRFPQVQLEKWSDIVNGYEGAAGTRVILFEPGTEPDPAMVTELVDKYLGLPYETQLLVMMKALNRNNVEAVGHADSAFCSEICYRFLVSLGIIEDTEIPENVWPKDFSEENDKIPLKIGAWGQLVPRKGQFTKQTTTDEVSTTVSTASDSTTTTVKVETQTLSYSSF